MFVWDTASRGVADVVAGEEGPVAGGFVVGRVP